MGGGGWVRGLTLGKKILQAAFGRKMHITTTVVDCEQFLSVPQNQSRKTKNRPARQLTRNHLPTPTQVK